MLEECDELSLNELEKSVPVKPKKLFTLDYNIMLGGRKAVRVICFNISNRMSDESYSVAWKFSFCCYYVLKWQMANGKKRKHFFLFLGFFPIQDAQLRFNRISMHAIGNRYISTVHTNRCPLLFGIQNREKVLKRKHFYETVVEFDLSSIEYDLVRTCVDFHLCIHKSNGFRGKIKKTLAN